MPGNSLSNQVFRRLASEQRDLITNPEDGIKILLSETDISDINAILKGPQGTPYQSGTFHVRLSLPHNYPLQAPTGKFLTRIFHPNVSEYGDICVNILKTDWTPTTTLRDIFRFVKCLLVEPYADSALNEEAAQLLRENYDLFSQRARYYAVAYASAGDSKVSQQQSQPDAGSPKASRRKQEPAVVSSTNKDSDSTQLSPAHKKVKMVSRKPLSQSLSRRRL